MIPTGIREKLVVDAWLDQTEAGLRDLMLASPDYFLALLDRVTHAEDGEPFHPSCREERSLLFSLAGHTLHRGLMAVAEAMAAGSEVDS